MDPDQISGAGGGRGVRHRGLLGYECVEEILRRISTPDGGRGDMDQGERFFDGVVLWRRLFFVPMESLL